MKINIFISTLNREEKLKRCINSILVNTHKDWDLKIISNIRRENILVNANNFLAQADGDWHLGLSDDMELMPDTLSKLAEVGQKAFPDTDGAIGINQVNIANAPESGLIVIGRKFANRFPGRRVICEDYEYFSDREQYLYMLLVGKFLYSPDVPVWHYHPAFYPEEMDATHIELRKDNPGEKDLEMFNVRQAKGWLWGRDFNRIKEAAVRLQGY